MPTQVEEDRRGDSDGSLAGGRLRRAGDTLSVAHFDGGDVDADRARVEVHVIASESGKFAPAQGAEGGEEDEGSVAGTYTVPEGEEPVRW
ncbi:hypothetical protein [Streptomyces sp. SID3343]|uniref:hypothetical protein n=1 Tax=Streptomyces sp. SID3343 TaxID=2690260 RepID=UPI001F23A6B9|nr:hypothetical protein [Streptomyces sp. SID3343]